MVLDRQGPIPDPPGLSKVVRGGNQEGGPEEGNPGDEEQPAGVDQGRNGSLLRGRGDVDAGMDGLTRHRDREYRRDPSAGNRD
jgi:hypothetical protein